MIMTGLQELTMTKDNEHEFTFDFYDNNNSDDDDNDQNNPVKDIKAFKDNIESPWSLKHPLKTKKRMTLQR